MIFSVWDGCTYTCTRVDQRAALWRWFSCLYEFCATRLWGPLGSSHSATPSLEQQQSFYCMSWFLTQKPSEAQVGRSGSVVLTGLWSGSWSRADGEQSWSLCRGLSHDRTTSGPPQVSQPTLHSDKNKLRRLLWCSFRHLGATPLWFSQLKRRKHHHHHHPSPSDRLSKSSRWDRNVAEIFGNCISPQNPWRVSLQLPKPSFTCLVQWTAKEKLQTKGLYFPRFCQYCFSTCLQ